MKKPAGTGTRADDKKMRVELKAMWKNAKSHRNNVVDYSEFKPPSPVPENEAEARFKVPEEYEEFNRLKEREHHLQFITKAEEKKMLEQPIDFEIVNSQTNWFEIETKMRKVIHTILQPIVKRTHKDREAMVLSQKSVLDHAARIAKLEEYVFYWKREDERTSGSVSKANSRERESAENAKSSRRTRTNANSPTPREQLRSIQAEHDASRRLPVRRNFNKIDDQNLRMDLLRADIDANFQTQQRINELTAN